jgi:hypothetical protein
MQDEVRKLMSAQLRPPTSGGSRYATRSQPQRPPLIASCSPFVRTVCSLQPFCCATNHYYCFGVTKQQLGYCFFSTGYWYGCSVSGSGHRGYIRLLETSFGSTRTVPWCFALLFIMKLTNRLRHSTVYSTDHWASFALYIKMGVR